MALFETLAEVRGRMYMCDEMALSTAVLEIDDGTDITELNRNQLLQLLEKKITSWEADEDNGLTKLLTLNDTFIKIAPPTVPAETPKDVSSEEQYLECGVEIKDEELLQELSSILLKESERQHKFGKKKDTSKIKVSQVDMAKQIDNAKEKQKEGVLMGEVKLLRAEIAALKEQVFENSKNVGPIGHSPRSTGLGHKEGLR
ncbi:hypothetical protein KUTeg_010769 [Tegillarca granosa]|uniref:Uncharacterized protein n=1 Tax=Tegillarca granosa TaxID=220873 RepID=A0ABQ9F254_TEGGR|nr:hypothetical protein KUTeg_010769 [Tegillarca granosa]